MKRGDTLSVGWLVDISFNWGLPSLCLCHFQVHNHVISIVFHLRVDFIELEVDDVCPS